MLDSLSSIHHDKIKYAQIKTEFLVKYGAINNKHTFDDEFMFTEQQKSFLSIFLGCIQNKTNSEQDTQQIDKKSLYDVPQHLLFALYILKYLKARDSKIKLLYALNVFRAIQKRLTLELSEMGSRDRIMGDCTVIHNLENQPVDQVEHDTESTITRSMHSKPVALSKRPDDTQYTGMFSAVGNADNGDIDIINMHMIDIMQYKFNDKFKNTVYSSCPVMPRFHSTFGSPIDR